MKRRWFNVIYFTCSGLACLFLGLIARNPVVAVAAVPVSVACLGLALMSLGHPQDRLSSTDCDINLPDPIRRSIRALGLAAPAMTLTLLLVYHVPLHFPQPSSINQRVAVSVARAQELALGQEAYHRYVWHYRSSRILRATEAVRERDFDLARRYLSEIAYFDFELNGHRDRWIYSNISQLCEIKGYRYFAQVWRDQTCLATDSAMKMLLIKPVTGAITQPGMARLLLSSSEQAIGSPATIELGTDL